MLQTSEKQLFRGKHTMCQTSEKTKSAANIRKAAFPWQTYDVSKIRKNKKCCKHPKNSFSMANIRCVKHPKNQKVLQTCENQLYQGKHPICQTSEKPKSAANIRKPALPWRTSDMPNIRKKTKSAANIRKAAFPGQTSNMSNIQKLKSAANIRKAALRRQTSNMSNIQKLKSAANIRKAAFPGRTSEMSNIRKNKKCCKHPKSSFSMANIRCVKHPKNQKVLQTCENQLYQGKHPICQTSEKPKSAANIRKPALPWRTSDMPNIRKTKKCCKPAKTSFTRANIRYVKHLKNQKVLQTSENQLYHGEHPICQISEKNKKCCKHPKSSFSRANIRYVKHSKTKKCCKHPKSSFTKANIQYVKHSKTKKCCKHPKSSFSRANIRNVKHPKKQKMLQTSENQLIQGKHPICQTSEKTKSAANIRKAAFPGQTSDVSNIRKTKMWCKHAKTSFTRANIRYVKHPKNQKVLQIFENQLYHGKHPICQTSEKKLKSAAIIRKAAFPGQTSDMSNIRKKQKVLQTCENQLKEGKHPICHTFKN